MTYEAFLRKNLKANDLAGDELHCFCPFHQDKNGASFSVNVKTGKWKCFAKCGAGSLKLLCKRLKVALPKKSEAEAEFKADPKQLFVPLAEVAVAYKRLRGVHGKGAMAYLKGRGISTAVLAKYQIGLGTDDRVWIPVFDAKGQCTNVRRYDWLHTGTAKFLNYGVGYGTNTLYPVGVVEKQQEVILFEGETDFLLAASLGIENAVTTTAGAGNWEDRFSRSLAGKTVFIVYDIDDPGILGAGQVARSLALSATNVYVVRLPISEPENGDFTDYMAATQFNRKEFLDLLGRTRSGECAAEKSLFTQLPKNSGVGKRLALRAVVSGKDLTPYNVPSSVTISCAPRDSGVCGGCPLKAYRGTATLPVPVTSKPVLKAVMASDANLDLALDKHFELPARCPGHKIEVTETQNLWDVRLSPDVDSGEEEGEAGSRRAFSMAELNTNLPYDLEVLATSDPKTQYSLLHILSAKSSQTGLDSWTTEGKEKLLKIWEV